MECVLNSWRVRPAIATVRGDRPRRPSAVPCTRDRYKNGLSTIRASVNLIAMDHKTVLRIREFALLANAIMREIPLPVPLEHEGIEESWNAALLDASDLHAVYDELPRPVQGLLNSAYRRCADVLERQKLTAFDAFVARYQLFADIHAVTGLTSEQLVSDDLLSSHLSLVPPGPDTGRETEDEETDEPGLFAAPFVPPVDDDLAGSFIDARRLYKHRRPRPGLWGAVGGALVALVCLGGLTWQHLTAPPAPAPTRSPALSIDVSVYVSGHVSGPDRDANIAVSIGERVGDIVTRLRSRRGEVGGQDRAVADAVSEGPGDVAASARPPTSAPTEEPRRRPPTEERARGAEAPGLVERIG